MNTDENFESINYKSDVITVIENYVYNLHEGTDKNVQNVVKSIKSLIADLKSNLPNCDEKSINIKDSQCNSILSMVDINMEISDESLGRNHKPNISSKSKVFMKEASCNTKEISKCDVIIQTQRLKNEIDPDYTQDLFYLKGQTNEVQDMMGTLRLKYDQVYETINVGMEKLNVIIEKYNSCDDSRLSSFNDADIETCSSWLRKWDEMVNTYNKFLEVREQLSLMTAKNDELEERSCFQMKETEAQFELIEELSTKNEQLARAIESVTMELAEEKEINEYQESEDRVLKSTMEKLREELRNFVKGHEKKMREILASFRSERSQWLAMNRALNCQLETEDRDFIMDRADERSYASDLVTTRESVRKHPLLLTDRKNAIISLRTTLTLMEDESLCLNQEKECWETEKAHLTTMAADEDFYPRKIIRELTTECAELEEDLRLATEQREQNRLCLNELRMACLEGRGTNCSVDVCREILARYDC